MAFFDLPLSKLETFTLPDYEPRDFDAFWKKTLKETAAFPLNATFEKIEHPGYKLVDVYDVTFAGFGGHPIKGWFIVPAGAKGKLPCLVTYIGYGGGRGFAQDHLTWVAAGFANFVMDTRGQGTSVWSSNGGTPDPVGSGPQQPAWMTRGIESPETYYYRRLFTDAARAVEAAASHPLVDASRIAVTGGSQGGGISIAAAALSGKKVKLCIPDVPFLCAYRKAVEMVDTAPYVEITSFLRGQRLSAGQVFKTLAYFDGVNFAPRITARNFWSVGLMDTTCPPSTVYAAYNRLKAPKEIRVWEFNSHEGGGGFHTLEKLAFAAKYL
jgi:cephalosporin-C deacetylase